MDRNRQWAILIESSSGDVLLTKNMNDIAYFSSFEDAEDCRCMLSILCCSNEDRTWNAEVVSVEPFGRTLKIRSPLGLVIDIFRVRG